MKIKKIELKNFKRFTDLVISGIPDTSKLVLVIGSNGSGKSSLFDAFDWLNKGPNKGVPYSYEEGTSYYRKNSDSDPDILIEMTDGKFIKKSGLSVTEGIDLVKRFLGRSSIRIVPRITNSASLSGVSSDMDSPATYIEHDTRFINDVFLYIQEINNALREPVFSGRQADTLKIFADFIKPLNDSLLNIFGNDEKTTIQIAEFQDASPGSTAKLIFKKGESKINYDLLSHGEKQVVTLLVNFIVRYKYYDNSIIFIDEMDSHLNTSLQYNLMKEIVNQWIPANAQLWTASHALGFIDYAKTNDNASTIDFDLLNFDVRQELYPVTKDKMDVYEIAIPKAMLTSILKGYQPVYAENNNDEYFNLALGQEGYFFLPAKDSTEVFTSVKKDQSKLGLRDRDYLKEDEIKSIKLIVPNLKVLSFYAFENYIYHPDNIAELNYPEFDKTDYINDIANQKNEKLLSIVGEIGTSRSHYTEFKNGIKNDGNIDEIIHLLRSDKFEEFYPFFNMKKHYQKKYLARFNFRPSELSKTNWFRSEILKILKN